MRLKADGQQREIAWSQFYKLYEPIISGYARSMGLRPDEARDIVQDVIVGFFAVQPRFVYDPSKGRFRGYLKVCTIHAIRRLARQGPIINGGDDIPDPVDHNAQDAWDQEWERQRLVLAIERLRASHGDSAAFRAFEAVVLRSQDPAAVAKELGVSRDVVYQAKSRMLARLRLALDEVDPELDC